MQSVDQSLDRELILAGTSAELRRWINEIVVHAEIDSTNTHLMDRAGVEDIDGVVCIAERQTKGKGRRGRTWLSPAGGSIALSLGMRFSISVARVSPLSLIVGVAVANAMNQSGVHGVSLKWPNDILLDGAKVGGVLIEIPAITEPLTVVIGIGINIGAGVEVGTRLGMPVGDVRAKNRKLSRNELAAQIIECVHKLGKQFESQGFSRLRADWEALHSHQNQGVRLVGPNETVEGTARGIGENGELILETDSGMRYFSGGEVSLRGA